MDRGEYRLICAVSADRDQAHVPVARHLWPCGTEGPVLGLAWQSAGAQLASQHTYSPSTI